MINKALIYAALFFMGTTGLFFGISKYKEHKLEVSRSEVKKLETKEVITSVTNDVKTIENNQSIIFKKDKEVKDEKIPSSIGKHTIDVS